MSITVDEIYSVLLARAGEGQPRPRLEPTRLALEALGDPQLAAPIVHITGTNGKSSTARITESLLRATGLRTGLFISPHLVNFTERFNINGEPVPDEMLIEVWESVAPILEFVDEKLKAEGKLRLSFFEAITALGFAIFADAPVDVVVLEVGMGGAWDATNAADADVAVFTPIDLDHTHVLGNTIHEVAETKSGIIKDGSIVVSSAQAPEGLEVLARASKGHEFLLEGEAFEVTSVARAVGGQVFSMRFAGKELNDLFLPLFGEYQSHNAALAIVAASSLLLESGGVLEEDVIAEGLALAKSPGRLERISSEPVILVDAAHNPHGVRALTNAVLENFAPEKLLLVFGVLNDKDAAGVIEILQPLASQIIVTQSESERAVPADELAELFTHPNLSVISDAEEAFRSAKEIASQEGALVLITGSITLIGEAVALARTEGWK